jgi:DHA1 family tetracycline resistance protein-like MFS transporter
MAKLLVLWLVVFISLMGFGITAVPFPIVAEQFQASPFWVTWGSSGVFSLFQLAATPLWGRLSDQIGRKPVLVVSLIGALVAYVWTAYADGLVALIAARAFAGLMSGNLSAAFAYVSDITEPGNRARYLGIISSAFGLGFAAGPVLGGQLGRMPDGTATLFVPGLTAAALTIVAIVGAIFFLKESLPANVRAERKAVVAASGVRESASPFKLLGRKPVLAGLSFAALAVSCGGAAMQSIYPIWARDIFQLQLNAVGAHFGVFACCSAVGQAVLTGILARRMGEKNAALLAVAGITVGLVLFALAHSIFATWVALIVLGLGLGLFTPTVTSLVSFEAEPTNQGAVMGVYNAGFSAGRVLGPAYAGESYRHLAAGAPFLISAILTVIGGIFLLRARTQRGTRAATT